MFTGYIIVLLYIDGIVLLFIDGIVLLFIDGIVLLFIDENFFIGYNDLLFFLICLYLFSMVAVEEALLSALKVLLM